MFRKQYKINKGYMSKGMSTATKKGATVPLSTSSPGKKHSPHTNGSGPPPITYSSEPQDDENMNEIVEENIELEVLLPDRTIRRHVVDPNVPMIDLLVNLAASNKLSPAGYNLKLISSETGKNIDYKANQTIGSLPGRTLQLVSKRSSEVDKSNVPKNVKPFEMTNRFSINLPHNQKRVLRISYNTPLSELFLKVCEEKNFDPNRYAFQLPGKPLDHVDMRSRISDLKSAEINLVTVGMGEQTQSMPDLTRSSSDKGPKTVTPVAENKKKGGFFSFLRKDKKQKHGHGATARQSRAQDLSLPPPQDQSTPLSPPDRKISQNIEIRQNDEIDGATAPRNHVPPVMKQIGKKRQAPLPPQKRPAPVKEGEISAASSSDDRRVNEISPSKLNIEPVNQKLHSRNSSDSSGYHELTLSGAESPEAYNAVNGAFKTSIDADSIDSGENLNGDSGVRDLSPDRTKGAAGDIQIGFSQTLPHKQKESKNQQPKKSSSLEDISAQKVIPSQKRKKAPAPPPPGGSRSTTPKNSLPPDHSSSPSFEQTSEPSHTITTSSTETVVQAEINTSALDIDTTDSYDHLEDSAVSGLDEIIDEHMIMLDDCSVHTEDLSDIPKSQRPCAFVPPPPPDEPPPPDTDLVDYHQKVDTKDVAVGIREDSSSLKNSPVDKEGDYHKEMAMFAEKMSKMKFAGDTEALRLPLDFYDSPRSDSDSGSILKHESLNSTPTPRDRATSGSDTSSIRTGSPESRNVMRRQRSGSGRNILVDEVDKKRYSAEIEAAESNFTVAVEEKEPVIHTEYNEEEKIITHSDEDMEESEEEYTETTEEIVFPISRFETLNLNEDIKEETKPIVSSQADYEPAKENLHVEEPEKNEKEEFVLTESDLKMVNYVVPKKEIKPESASVESPSADTSSHRHRRLIQLSPPRSKYGVHIPVASVWDYDPDETPPRETVQHRHSQLTPQKELSFSPHSEGEVENVLEEKSISQIAMPAMRSPVKELDFSDKSGPDSKKAVSSATLNLSYKRESPKSTVHSYHVGNVSKESVTERPGVSESQSSSSIQAHSEQLKQQMAMWQEQLAENQKLLTSKNIDPEQLQENLKIQQQLMLQVQECMQALTKQQAIQQTGDSASIDSPLSSADNTPKSTPRNSTTSLLDNSRSSVASKTVSSRTEFTKPPSAPSPPPLSTENPAIKKLKLPKTRTPKNDPRFERKLDPREELMFAIRGFSKGGLKKVPVNEIRWQGSFVPQS